MWALPRTLPGGVLAPHLYQTGRLVHHRWGMPEPPPDSPAAPLEEIELVLVPGVGFDLQGGRIGFGGGFYDRLLVQLNAVRVGVAYEQSTVEEIPTDDHDCRVGYLVRPSGLMTIFEPDKCGC